jgi:formylglycine-generating enzyme required for sulfatase activity
MSKRLLIFSGIVLSLLYGCQLHGTDPDTAGAKGGSSEVKTALIHGTIYALDTHNGTKKLNPVSQAFVGLYPADFVPFDTTFKYDSTETDNNGSYQIIPRDTGTFNLISSRGDGEAAIHKDITVKSGDSVSVSDTLAPLSSLSGTVISPPDRGDTTVVFIPGTPWHTRAATGERFTLSVPPGTFIIHIAFIKRDTTVPLDSAVQIHLVDTAITVGVPPDTTLELDTITVDTTLDIEPAVPDTRDSTVIDTVVGDSGTIDTIQKETLPVNPTDGMALIETQGQSFQMGSSIGNPDEQPVHTVSFTYNFWMDTVEVTIERFKTVMGYIPIDPVFSGNESHLLPALGINWYEAVLYCNAYSNKFGLDTVYRYRQQQYDGKRCILLSELQIDSSTAGFRLPTEAEWEFAARSLSEKWRNGWQVRFENNDSAAVYAWFLYNSFDPEPRIFANVPHVVATRKPNRFGLYDMYGNAEEWCNDWYDPTYYRRFSPMYNGESNAGNPFGPDSGTTRILRGGTWNSTITQINATVRYSGSPDNKDSGGGDEFFWETRGFRVVLMEQ